MSENNGPKTVAALWAMAVISFLFMLLRFVCKAMHSRRLGIDDGLLCVSWLFTIIYAALITESVRYGMGKHSVDILPENESPMYKYLFIGEFFSLIAIPTSKTSFTVTLLRLSTRRWQKVLLWFIIVTMNLVMWLCAILLFLQCTPVERNWNKDLKGTCWKSKVQDNYSIFAGAYSAFLDFVLAMLPWIMIWRLQMNMKEKLGVMIAMSFGFLAGIVAAVKTSYLPGVGNFDDMPFMIIELLIWSDAETAVTILAASIPFFRVLIRNATTRGGATDQYRQSYRLESGDNMKKSARRSKHLGIAGPAGRREEMSDSSSLGEILPIQGQGIVKRNEITVEYHEDKDLDIGA
ncbi:putative integral membrane protein [Melanomma pulvis-pyrius CBS 109.77]|uniref:Putative integral membrane protein n=1 Tax=Melanomma pulvis-pyrius CBS 109.77 TaxID=1314802 RepID=A0A6A6XXC1_9PLEO|nr:putative integral membrane protein [Melanomma pulvis-pyrius CBS 109.77]